jgi:hypothetical protein
LQHEGIPEKKQLDAFHVAIASVNFNEKYQNITICRPEELVDYED